MTAATVPVVDAPWYSRLWAGALFLLLLCTGIWWLFHVPAVAHWAVSVTGQDNEAGGHYGFWSGFGGSIPDVLLITGGLAFYWHSSCHQSGCWLPGRHHTADGSAKLCRWHHPDIRGRKLTAAVIAELHALGLGRQQ